MTEQEKRYYYKMLCKERLMPFADRGGHLYGFISFLIGAPGQFQGKDPWEIVEDDPFGVECYVEQVFCDPEYRGTSKLKEWFRFKKHIESTFPNVKGYAWRRYKNDKLFVHEGGEKCLTP